MSLIYVVVSLRIKTFLYKNIRVFLIKLYLIIEKRMMEEIFP